MSGDRARANMAENANKSTARTEFSNPEDPMRDPKVRKIETEIALAKRGVTNSITRALALQKKIENAIAKGANPESGIIIGMKKIGLGHVEMAASSNTLLETETDALVSIFAEIIVQDETKKAEIDPKIIHAEQEVINYDEKLSKCRDATIALFDTVEEVPTEATGSRGRSPPRGGQPISKMNFLLPGELSGGCSTADFNKFRRDFNMWFEASFPGGESGPAVWGTLNSK